MWNDIIAPIIVAVAGAFIISITIWIIKKCKKHREDKKNHNKRIENLLTNTYLETKCTQTALITVNNGSGQKYADAISEERGKLQKTLKETWGLHYEYLD